MLGKCKTASIVTRSAAANCRPSLGNTWRPHPGPGLTFVYRAGIRGDCHRPATISAAAPRRWPPGPGPFPPGRCGR